jgi:hypothetical protein
MFLIVYKYELPITLISMSGNYVKIISRERKIHYKGKDIG